MRTAASTSASRRRQTPEAVVARHVRDAANRDALDAQLQEVAEGILERRDVDLETLQLIALNQNWTKHPHLALVYFHCCANHPDAFVCNDEKLHGDAGASVRARLLRVLDAPPGVQEAVRCQVSVREQNSASAHIWFCASCNRKIEHNERKMLQFALHELPTSFLATPGECVRFAGVPVTIVEKHLQVITAGGKMYHLNPDLVPDRDAVRVCGSCVPEPRANQFSIASGHDYGRQGDLPDLTDVAKSCISPVRRFGLELSLSGMQCSGQAIHFPSDGPVVCAASLPRVGDECVPRVTFVGSHEQWRVTKHKFRKLYALPVDDVYAWLRVLSVVNNVFARKQIRVDESRARRHALEQLQQRIEENVLCTTAEYVRNVDAQTSGEQQLQHPQQQYTMEMQFH